MIRSMGFSKKNYGFTLIYTVQAMQCYIDCLFILFIWTAEVLLTAYNYFNRWPLHLVNQGNVFQGLHKAWFSSVFILNWLENYSKTGTQKSVLKHPSISVAHPLLSGHYRVSLICSKIRKSFDKYHTHRFMGFETDFVIQFLHPFLAVHTQLG